MTRSTNDKPVPVIGVGASAGSLDPLREFLFRLPPQMPFSIVVIKHLTSEGPSDFFHLLKSHYPGVEELKNGSVAMPSRVYIAPPQSAVTLHHNQFQLANADSAFFLPINHFFASLAKARGEHAVGVILSGSGSDGTLGALAIKQAGGVTFAQEPQSAEFVGMPHHAIAADAVDFVEPPGQISQMVSELLPFPNRLRPIRPEEREELEDFFGWLEATEGVDLRPYRLHLLQRRLYHRMQLVEQTDISDYKEYILDHPRESQELFEECLIPMTSCFRDPEAWLALSRLTHNYLKGTKPNRPLKGWSVGCSTGEEAYTLAIILHEIAEALGHTQPIKVYATDRSLQALKSAKEGEFPKRHCEHISEERLQRYFDATKTGYKAKPFLRELLVFSAHDVLEDPTFGQIDLISCRNMLIYLRPDAQKEVINKLHFALRTGGILFLGRSEGIGKQEQLKELLQEYRIFQKEGPVSRGKTPLPEPHHFVAGRARHHTDHELIDAVSQSILKVTGGACIVTDHTCTVRHVMGNLRRFLELPDNLLSLNLIDMAPETLKSDLSAAIYEAGQTGASVEVIQSSQSQEGVRIHIQPHTPAKKQETFFLVLFLPAQEAHTPQKTNEGTQRINALSRLLRDTQDSLQHLQLNVRSDQAELQSANEELQTTNEELQSVNEELHMINSEHQAKLSELAALNDDMENFLESTGIATIFLDENNCIRRFTPAIQEQFELLHSDIGRPLDQLAGKLTQADTQWLQEALQQELKPGQELEQECQTLKGQVFLTNVHPFLNSKHQARGKVVSFVDLTDLRQAERERSHWFEHSADMHCIASFQGEFLQLNKRWSEILGWSKEELMARNFMTLIHPDDIQKTEDVISEYDDTKRTDRLYHFENRYLCRTGEYRWLSWNSVFLPQEQKIIATARDVTELKFIQKALQESELRFRTIAEVAQIGIFEADEQGQLIYVNPAAAQLLGYESPTALKESSGSQYHTPTNTRQRLFQSISEYGSIDNQEVPMQTKTGASRTFLLSAHMEPEKRIIRGTLFDITERKRTEAALKASEAKFRSVLTHSPDFIVSIDKEGRYLFVNRVAPELRMTPEQLVGLSMFDFLPTERHSEMREAIETVFAEGEIVSFTNYTELAKGKRTWHLNRMGPISDHDGRTIAAAIITTDITESQRQREKLLQYESMVHAANDLMAYVGTDYHYKALNPTYAAFWNQKAQSAENQHIEVLMGVRGFYEIKEHIDRCLNGERVRFRQWVTGRTEEPKYMDASYNPIYNDCGAVKGVVASIRDITELRLYEERLESTLQELTLSNQALEQFAYVASHDLREPLNTIVNYIKLLKRLYSDSFDDQGTKMLGFIVEASSRLKDLVKGLLDYSRLRNDAPTPNQISCRSLLEEIIQDLGDAIADATIEVHTDLTITGNHTQIRQLFQNLISNALKFKREGIPAHIQIHSKENEHHWLFDVSDNGIGIDEQFYSKIFEIFRRLHTTEDYQGIGLGLALCKRVVHLHGGTISVDSTVNEGTTFTFTIKKPLSLQEEDPYQDDDQQNDDEDLSTPP